MKDLKTLFAPCIVLLAASACSPEAQAPAQNEVAEASRPIPQQAALNQAGQGAAVEATLPAPQQAATRHRCGWLQNPTPGNWWLIDREGEWLLGVQGGYQAPGMDDIPDMIEGEWTAVNGNYGYGCACMDVVTDPASKRVVKLVSATPKRLAQCRADRRLPKPDGD